MKYLLLILIISCSHREEPPSITGNQSRSMLGYIDLYVDSPDQENFIFFEFDDEKLGRKKYYRGRVVISDNDFNNLKSFKTFGHTHYGARQFWASERKIVFQNVKKQKSFIVDLDSKAKKMIDGAIEMAHPKRELYLIKNKEHLKSRGKAINRISIHNGEKVVSKVNFKNVLNSIPECLQYRELCQRRGTLKHPKFSKSGNFVFLVFLAEEKSGRKIKKGIIWDYKGSTFKNIGNIGSHPMWIGDEGIFSFVNRNFKTRRRDIETIDIDSGERKILYRGILAAHGVFHPKKSHLIISDVYDYPKKGMYSIVLTDIESRRERVLSQYGLPKSKNKKDRVHGHPVWSQDGKSIFFNQVLNEKSVLSRMPVF